MVQARAVKWRAGFSDEEWSVYLPVIEAVRRAGVPFAIGGGIAMSYYSGMWRNTKDVDFYVRASDVETMKSLLHGQGFEDYFPTLSYDRNWIYRGYRGGYIVDVMWQLANYRAAVELDWLTRAEAVEMHGAEVRMLAPEELIFAKLYVMQRERCDWPDLFNVLWRRSAGLDWERLLRRVGEDRRLVAGLVEVFSWLCPAEARGLPAWLWDELGVKGPGPAAGRITEMQPGECDTERVRLLDSRPWFAPTVVKAEGEAPGRMRSV